MRRVSRVVVIAAAATGVVLGAGAFALASGGEDEGGHVSTAERQQAVQSALAATGGGKANAVERDGEDGATYEVEVTKPDGSTVDVRLGADYSVVVIDPDSEPANDRD